MATDGSTAPTGAERFRYAQEGGGRLGPPPDDTAARAVADHLQHWSDAAVVEKPGRKPERSRDVAGRPVADLITRFRDAATAQESSAGSLDTYRELRAAGQDLIASRDAAAVAEVLCSDSRLWPWAGPRDNGSRMTLRGLALRGGDGSTGFPAGNPWGIPADATVEQAIRQVWAPVGSYVPAFVDRLVERVFAVGLVAHPDGDFVTYLYGSTVLAREIDWEAPVEHLMTTDGVTAEVGWGAAPRVVSDREVVPLLGGPLPAPLRELARIHGSLYFSGLDGHFDSDGLERYTWGLDDEDDDESTLADRLGFPPERYVLFAGYQDGGAALDLDQLDAYGNPLIVGHDCNDGLDTANATAFWTWFDQEFQFYLISD